MSEFYIGVMSGTSLDGIDLALCEIEDDAFELLLCASYPFDAELKSDILNAINAQTTLKNIGEIDIRLGKMYADALEKFIEENSLKRVKIRAIGLHGQTLWHEPESQNPFSMQLGNANILTARLGICVVSDFRQKDIALGGQGAPFTPAFHEFLFSKLSGNVAVLNIGGMANITLLRERLSGYDTGCGNVLMDYWISKYNGSPYDKDGEWAKSGTPNRELLREFLKEPYFLKSPPKSTGRELFGEKWLKKQLSEFAKKNQNCSYLKARDIQATLLELSVQSIANEIKKSDTTLLIVCGGGINNRYLMERLQEELGDIKIASSDEYGVSSEFMEAMAFAWLAHERIHKKCVKISSVSGALRDSILGAIYE